MYDNIDRSKKMISEYLGFDSDYIILGLAGNYSAHPHNYKYGADR